MSRSPGELAKRAVAVFAREGFAALAVKCFTNICRTVYAKDRYLVFSNSLYEHRPTCQVGSISVTVVSSIEEMKLLADRASDFVEANDNRLKSHIANQGMLFCIVVNGKVAHQSWVCSQRHAEVDPIAPHLNYDGRAYIGACETLPEFRGRGLYPRVLCVICQTLRSKGFATAVLTVSPENKPSISGVLKAGFQQSGEGTLTQFLGRSVWRENLTIKDAT